MESTVELDYLVIGHVTQDLVDGAFIPGGTVSYAARTARMLGARVGAVTSASPDLDLSYVLDGILVTRVPAAATTTFENIYTPEGRRQMLHSTAETLVREMVPANWRPAVVHLGPVARECAPELADAFGDAFVGITPQGWLRCWDHAGHVSSCQWEDSELWLAHADALVLSDEDVTDDLLLAQYAAQTRVLVVTRGAAGCTVYTAGQTRDFPAPVVREVDPTGAGDIFAAAFFLWMQRRNDPWLAARFANCLAAHSVARVGLSSTPVAGEVALCKQNIGDR